MQYSIVAQTDVLVVVPAYMFGRIWTLSCAKQAFWHQVHVFFSALLAAMMFITISLLCGCPASTVMQLICFERRHAFRPQIFIVHAILRR